MASSLDVALKRCAWPIMIDGDRCFIRALKDSEMKLIDTFREEDESVGYLIGCGLVNEDKSQAIPQKQDETAKQFGGRVLSYDFSTDVKALLVSKILKLTEGFPSVDELKKN